MGKVNFFYEGIPEFKIDKGKTEPLIHRIIEDHHFITGPVNIIFCSDNYLIELNRKFLRHDYYTDIITFNDCKNNTIAGELYISYERVSENSVHFSESIDNELLRVIIHGILHLVGYNDNTEKMSGIIRDRENYYLKLNCISNKNVTGI